MESTGDFIFTFTATNMQVQNLQGGLFLRKILRSRQTGMKIGTRNVRSLYRAGSLKAAARELVRYKLDVVGVQEGIYNERVHQLFIDFKKAYDSVRREVLHKILIEFGIPRKLVRLVKMSLTETYSRVWVGKNVSDRFPITNGLKQGDALSPMLFNFAL